MDGVAVSFDWTLDQKLTCPHCAATWLYEAGDSGFAQLDFQQHIKEAHTTTDSALHCKVSASQAKL